VRRGPPRSVSRASRGPLFSTKSYFPADHEANCALAATSWNAEDDAMTPVCSSMSPTWAGVEPCGISTTMSALPAVELSTLLSTHTDAMASGASSAPTTMIVITLRR